MNKIRYQQGVGLIEVLIALLVLAVGVLGFVSLQYRAVGESAEAGHRIQAMNLARDLADRVRVNRGVLSEYKSRMSNAALQAQGGDCINHGCTAKQLAAFDVAQVTTQVHNQGMTMNMLDCPNTNNKRQCVYVAWGDTAATNGGDLEDCTNGNYYNPNSTCIIMELY